MNRGLRLVVEPRSAISPPMPASVPPPVLFDWQADEDGDLTDYDVETALAVLDHHEVTCVRDAGRKLRRYFAGGSRRAS